MLTTSLKNAFKRSSLFGKQSTPQAFRALTYFNTNDPNQLQLRVTSRGENCTSYISTGRFEWKMDESKKLGGNDEGPSPLESLLGSLAGCEQMTLYYIARKLNIDIGKVVITADGFVDPRGFRGEESVPSHFNKVILDVHIHSLEGEDVIGQLKEKVETQCPVHSLFKAAGVQVESQWVVNVGA